MPRCQSDRLNAKSAEAYLRRRRCVKVSEPMQVTDVLVKLRSEQISYVIQHHGLMIGSIPILNRHMNANIVHQLRFSHRTLQRCLYASITGSPSDSNPYTVGPFKVFDRDAKRLQRDRAATRDGGERSRTVDYLRNEVADMMIERFLVGLNHSKPQLALIVL